MFNIDWNEKVKASIPTTLFHRSTEINTIIQNRLTQSLPAAGREWSDERVSQIEITDCLSAEQAGFTLHTSLRTGFQLNEWILLYEVCNFDPLI